MNANQDGSLGSDRLSKYESTWEPQSPRGNKIWIIPSGSCAATAGNLPPLWSTLFWHLRTNFDLWSFIVPIMTVKQIQKEDPKMVSVSGFLNSLASFWAQLRIVCVQVNSYQRGLRFLFAFCVCASEKFVEGNIKESKRANFCHGHRPCALTLNSCWHLTTWEGDFSVLNIHILHIFSSEIILTSW